MTRRDAFWMSTLPDIQGTGRIPRIIHQTFRTRALPDHLQRNVDMLRSLNPEWDYRLYDDQDCERFILEHYGEHVLDVYLRIYPAYGAARADLFRYLAVYAVGGVYLDIKSNFDRPIDAAIAPGDAFIVAQWDNQSGGAHPGFGLHPELAAWPGGEIQQWHVIAARGHPFLRSVIAKVLANIENYRPWRSGVGRIGVLRLTGPIAYTQAIMPILDQHPRRCIADAAAIGLHYSIGGGYEHGSVFKNHYSLLTSPVARLPLWAKPPALLYGYLKRRVQERASRRAAASA